MPHEVNFKNLEKALGFLHSAFCSLCYSVSCVCKVVCTRQQTFHQISVFSFKKLSSSNLSTFGASTFGCGVLQPAITKDNCNCYVSALLSKTRHTYACMYINISGKKC